MSYKQALSLKRFDAVVLAAAFTLAAFSAASLASSAGCRSQVRPDAFLQAVVDCRGVGLPAAQAVAETVSCLAVAAGPESPAALDCLAGVANALGATVAEVTCLVHRLATSDEGAAADAGAAPASRVSAVAPLARAFLARNRIAVVP